MNREQLEHAIRAACDISGDHELYIFGSQAIVGQYPDAPEQLRQSIEVDLSPKNRPEAIHKIDGALGENSLFHQTHGFYVHGVSIETVARPSGWNERTHKVQETMNENNIGWCIEAHDLAASKRIAFREKDRVFVRRLLLESMIDADKLIKRIRSIETEKDVKEQALRWVERMATEL